jgi:hypothetical protein
MTVCEGQDGQISIYYREQLMAWEEIQQRPVTAKPSDQPQNSSSSRHDTRDTAPLEPEELSADAATKAKGGAKGLSPGGQPGRKGHF